MLKHSPDHRADPPKEGKRNTGAFLSMRAPKNRKLRTIVSKDTLLDSKSKNSSSLERRTHKRSRSNPFILESMMAEGGGVGELHAPPQLPPRNLDNSLSPLHATAIHTSARRDSILTTPIESSLEFSSPSSADIVRRPASDKPLPPLPDNASVSPKAMHVRLLKSSDDDVDADRISQTSGPFEEIGGNGRSKVSPLPDRAVVGRSATMGRENTTLAPSSDSDNEGDDQYAEIADFQQYMKMSSAPIDKSKTFPSRRPMAGNDSDGLQPSGKKHHNKSTSSMQPVSPQPQGRKDSSGTSAPLISTLRKKLKKSTPRNDQAPVPREAAQSPPLPPHHTITSVPSLVRSATMPPKQSPIHIQDSRPLPPSPIKGMPASLNRKISSGSNIYEVIDEDFLHKVRNRPSRQNSQRETLAHWLPQVDRSLWPQYIEVVKTFFSLSQIQEQWVETVKSIMKDVDPEDVQPPYSKLCSEPFPPSLAAPEEDLKEENEDAEEERDSIAPLNEKGAGALKIQLHHRQKEKRTPANATSPQSEKLRTLFHLAASNNPQQPKKHNSEQVEHPANSSPLSSPSGGSFKQSAGNDDLILMLNQCQEYDSEEDSSSETDSDVEFISESSDLDSDLESDIPLHASHENILNDLLKNVASEQQADDLPQPLLPLKDTKEKSKPPVKPKPRRVFIPQTDLDIALEQRASESNDSDLVSTDSALTKSPHSNNSAMEFDLEKMAEETREAERKDTDLESSSAETEGPCVEHNVKPSEFIRRKKAKFRLRSKDGEMRSVDRSCEDSGTFEYTAPSAMPSGTPAA